MNEKIDLNDVCFAMHVDPDKLVEMLETLRASGNPAFTDLLKKQEMNITLNPFYSPCVCGNFSERHIQGNFSDHHAHEAFLGSKYLCKTSVCGNCGRMAPRRQDWSNGES